MEPLALSSASAANVLRPIGANQPDLAAVLREGQILSGEVLQTLDGGSILVGIGKHRVPAQTDVKLTPGQRFLFQIELQDTTVVLRILGSSNGSDSDLLRALRAVVGQDRPIGEILGELASALRGGAASPDAPAPSERSLLARLLGTGFRPGEGGDALRETLRSGGLVYESKLAAAALASLPVSRRAALGNELAGWLASELVDPKSPGGAAPLLAQLGVAARELFDGLVGQPGGEGREAALARWSAGRLSGAPPDFERLLEALLARSRLDDVDGALQRLPRSTLARLGRPLQALLVGALLGTDGEAATPLDPKSPGLARDLKALLLRAFAELPDGAGRESVARALSAIEAEQLLNVARTHFREAPHWSLPIPDGDGWATLHLFFQTGDERVDERDAEGGGADEDVPRRFTVAVDFRNTGPVRADLVVRSDAVAVRLQATRDDVLDRMRAATGELSERLAIGGRRVILGFGKIAPADVPLGSGPDGVRYLRENHLCDLKG